MSDPRDELNPSEIGTIEADVQKEIDREAKQAAKDKLRTEIKARLKQERGLSEPSETVRIDLPPYADRILLDNVAYLQGMTYTVRASVAAMMREIMQNTWEHQSVVDGKPENFYRKQLDSRITPAGVVNGTSILRV